MAFVKGPALGGTERSPKRGVTGADKTGRNHATAGGLIHARSAAPETVAVFPSVPIEGDHV